RLRTAPVEVELDHDVGATRDGEGLWTLGLHGQRLLPCGGLQKVHVSPPRESAAPWPRSARRAGLWRGRLRCRSSGQTGPGRRGRGACLASPGGPRRSPVPPPAPPWPSGRGSAVATDCAAARTPPAGLAWPLRSFPPTARPAQRSAIAHLRL